MSQITKVYPAYIIEELICLNAVDKDEYNLEVIEFKYGVQGRWCAYCVVTFKDVSTGKYYTCLYKEGEDSGLVKNREGAIDCTEVAPVEATVVHYLPVDV